MQHRGRGLTHALEGARQARRLVFPMHSQTARDLSSPLLEKNMRAEGPVASTVDRRVDAGHTAP